MVEAHKKYLERKQKGEISSDPSQASNSTDSATNADGKLEGSTTEDKTGNEGSKNEEGDGVGGVQRLDEVVGCLPPGFFFNEPKGYKKVNKTCTVGLYLSSTYFAPCLVAMCASYH